MATNKNVGKSSNTFTEMTPEATTPFTGGGSSEVAISSLNSYREESETKKNKKIDELTNEVSDVILASGESLKQKFNFAGFFDKLDALGDLPFGDKLNSLMSSFLNSQLDKLKKAANESLNSAWNGLKDMAKSQVKKLLDLVISRIYLPDAVYLASIVGLYNTGSNLRYANDYARTKAIRADYVLSLGWIDDTIGKTYSIINNYNNTMTDIRSCSYYSCIKVFDYMLNFLKEENKSVLRNIDSYNYQIRLVKTDITTSESIIDSLQNEKGLQNTTETRREEIDILIDLEKEKIKNYESKIKDIENERAPWDDYDYKYRDCIAKSFRDLLVNSVGNFNVSKVQSYFTKYNVKPAWYGETDPDFNKRYKLTISDVDKMAPFYTESGFNRNIKNDLGDTRLVQTSKLPKYITLRNVFLKYIYVYLTNTSFFPAGTQLASKELYERLCYPTMDHLSQIADKFLGTMIEDGLGKMAIDTLLGIERAIYDYTRSVESAMDDPLAHEYLQLMSYGQELPPPIIPNKNTNIDNINDINQDDVNNRKIDETTLEKLIKYYFKQMDSNYHHIFIKNILVDLNKLHNQEKNTDNKSLYKNFIIYHYGEYVFNEEFDIETYFKNVSSDYILSMTINIFKDIYFMHYKNRYFLENYETIDDKLYNEIFLKHYKILKDYFYESYINKLNNSEIYQLLVTIYLRIADYAVSHTKYLNVLITFLRKHYSENACKPTFKIESYLDSLTDDERKRKLIEILKDLDKELMENPIFIEIKDDLFDNIFVELLPDYSIVIDIEKGGDIDINDKDTINNIIKDLMDNSDKSFINYIRDFDNKKWIDGTKTLDSEKDDIENFVPEKYLNYVIFYNPEI